MAEEPISSDALRVELTHALLEAGFAIHHAHLPSGGVRLVVDEGGPHGDGILVSWAAAVTLDSDERRREAYEVVLATMNRALAEVLTALDYTVVPQGQYGVPLVTGRRHPGASGVA
ncbi:MAG TPA: hypothetical protein VG455_09975 [Acidimicrobiales bacterium]|nr:hypothetical protein [Acidimicrobiales bacterium]